MSVTIKDIAENTKTIFMSDSSLRTLLDFERVLDELNVYVFQNWRTGELVEGPKYEKYFITCTFMWAKKNMPDPTGGEKLLQYGCEVSYQQSRLVAPVKIKTPDDFKPGTKVAKLASSPVWLVTVTMPKSLMKEIRTGSIEVGNEQLDLEEIESAYELGLDDDQHKTTETQQDAQQAKQQQTIA